MIVFILNVSNSQDLRNMDISGFLELQVVDEEIGSDRKRVQDFL